ncbi:MAG: hypothetical protein Q4C60_03615 [Eubacteriales bacterium]|nr:hypothetical protein [Eubacteriales bacterium]
MILIWGMREICDILDVVARSGGVDAGVRRRGRPSGKRKRRCGRRGSAERQTVREEKTEVRTPGFGRKCTAPDGEISNRSAGQREQEAGI